MKYVYLITLLSGILTSPAGKGNIPNKMLTANGADRPASLGITGDTSDITTPTKGGVVLMGGGKDVDAAFKWMIEQSGGGDVVILRATGTDAYNSYVNKLGKVNSVETLKIDSRELAENEKVAATIRNAEMLFIAGGDQSNYLKYWKGTKTMDAINYLLTEKKAPVGGTSAGCAILGEAYYSGEKESVTSKEALADPYNPNVTVYPGGFLHAPFLDKVITDQHYVARKRQGRHMAFLARLIKDHNFAPKGIAADERTAVCIDDAGQAKVFGSGTAYFLQTDSHRQPENCVQGHALNWKADQKAVKVYEIPASLMGAGNFDVAGFSEQSAQGGKWQWWNVENGVLQIINKD
ncbi:cyanophycinase [Pararcticibacter amylolyticus]|uniref:Cyanophycinase n=1 Tax=Pararcticibacter amylolyticus TaxID=2173175 RepID=A0A2U2PHT2_9SPHI|nr:cyanophycinase [Pararcticibacter amylolyticus]PWG80951.1 cyanophycinase [Pararcticibacter amylolyticus]